MYLKVHWNEIQSKHTCISEDLMTCVMILLQMVNSKIMIKHGALQLYVYISFHIMVHNSLRIYLLTFLQGLPIVFNM